MEQEAGFSRGRRDGKLGEAARTGAALPTQEQAQRYTFLPFTQATELLQTHPPPAGFQSTRPTSGRCGKAAVRQLRKALRVSNGMRGDVEAGAWSAEAALLKKRPSTAICCTLHLLPERALWPDLARPCPSPGCREQRQRSAAGAAAAGTTSMEGLEDQAVRHAQRHSLQGRWAMVARASRLPGTPHPSQSPG